MDERSLRHRMECFLLCGTGPGRRPPGRRSLPDTATEHAEHTREEQTRPEQTRKMPPLGRWRPRPQASRHSDVPLLEASYDAIFRRVETALRGAREQILRELAQAASQWERLRSHPQSRRLLRVQNDRRLQTWGLFDYLLERSRREPEPRERIGIEAAQLALAIAERLPAELYGEERLADFRCAALTELANRLRLAGHLEGARRALTQAKSHLDRGTGDLLDRANLTQRLFELLRDQGDFENSLLALEQAKSLFRKLGDDRLRRVSLLPLRGGAKPQAEGREAPGETPEEENGGGREVRRPLR